MEYLTAKLSDGGRMMTTLSRDEADSVCRKISAGDIEYKSVFKDTSKAFVGVVELSGETRAVIKVPRSRSERKWERFLTLFRNGQSLRQFQQHLKLAELGVRAPLPLLAVEWRSKGVVVDGFYIYEFINGHQGLQGERDIIVKELLKLYRLGYRRKDPKPENFVVTPAGVYLIDFTLDRPFFFRKTRLAMELSQFSGSINRYETYARDLGLNDLVIRLGWPLQRFSQRVRRIRRNISKRLK